MRNLQLSSLEDVRSGPLVKGKDGQAGGLLMEQMSDSLYVWIMSLHCLMHLFLIETKGLKKFQRTRGVQSDMTDTSKDI